jgi:hypothetical protein
MPETPPHMPKAERSPWANTPTSSSPMSHINLARRAACVEFSRTITLLNVAQDPADQPGFLNAGNNPQTPPTEHGHRASACINARRGCGRWRTRSTELGLRERWEICRNTVKHGLAPQGSGAVQPFRVRPKNPSLISDLRYCPISGAAFAMRWPPRQST